MEYKMFDLVFKKNKEDVTFFRANLNSRQYTTEPTGTVFAIINLKTHLISQLQDETLRNGVEEPTFFDLLIDNPNPSLNWEQIKSLNFWWVYSTGNSFTYTPKINGMPYGLYVLPSTQVTVVATSEIIDYYEYTVESTVYRIYPDEMIHFRRMFPSNEFKYAHILGQAKELQMSYKYMTLESSTLDFVQSFLDADGVSPYILTADQNIAPEQLKKLKEGFNDTIGNSKYQVQAIIGAGANVEPLGKSTTADGLAAKESSETTNKLCRIWDVPLNQLDQDFGTQATASVMTKNFYDRSLASDVRNFEQTITRWGRQFDIEFEYNIIDYQVDNEEEVRKQELHDFGLGLKNRNDLRAARGLDPVANGDTYMISGGYYPLDDLLFNEPIDDSKKKALT